jgi:hypothetical protein
MTHYLRRQQASIDKRIRFELDTKGEAKSFLMKSYQEGLMEWKAQHNKNKKASKQQKLSKAST